MPSLTDPEKQELQATHQLFKQLQPNLSDEQVWEEIKVSLDTTKLPTKSIFSEDIEVEIGSEYNTEKDIIIHNPNGIEETYSPLGSWENFKAWLGNRPIVCNAVSLDSACSTAQLNINGVGSLQGFHQACAMPLPTLESLPIQEGYSYHSFRAGNIPSFNNIAPETPIARGGSTGGTTSLGGSCGGPPPALISLLKGVTVAVVVQGFLGFFKVILKRAFPLHHAKIDKWFSWIDTIVLIIGVGSLMFAVGATLATAGLAGLPLLALISLSALLAGYLARKGSEMIANFVCEMIIVVNHYISKALRFVEAPDSLVDLFWKDYSNLTRVKVGVCQHCGIKPRETISPNCGHVAYCIDCAPLNAKCPCGKALAKEMRAIYAKRTICACRGCIDLTLCSRCDPSQRQLANVIAIYPGAQREYSCKKHANSTALIHLVIPFKRGDTCDPLNNNNNNININ